MISQTEPKAHIFAWRHFENLSKDDRQLIVLVNQGDGIKQAINFVKDLINKYLVTVLL